MFKIVLFFIFVATQAFAYDSNYITDFGIYVYGDIQALQNAFILVQTIAQSDILPWILAMIGAFFLPYSAYDYFKSQDFAKFVANVSFMSISFLALDTANLGVTVHIEDLRAETSTSGLPAKTYSKIDNIPYPIALVTSTVSTIVDGIKREFEDAIQIINVSNGLDVNGMSYEGVGFMGGLGDVLKITKMASFSLDSNLSKFGRASQAYINDCVLQQAITINPDLISVLKTPPNDIFKAISPANIGLTGATSEITYNGATTSCADFYGAEINSKYAATAQALVEKLDKNIEGDLTSNNYINSLKSAGAKVDDSFISSEVGKFNAYAMNVAALAPVSNAFRNYLTDINSGQDVANVITAGASMADLQSEGAGKFKWMAEIIPLGFHYMLGVIYSISILIMIVATALGFQKGMMVWKNFAKGLLTFEFIKIALVIVNSTVNQYSALHAADFLASVGQNPASISALPYYINYIASMTGVAGMLGIAAIFMIPGMVFSGEVAMAAGAISGLASKYKGNDIQTATSESAAQKAQNEAWENDLKDQAKLDNMGVSVPHGMGATQFYSEYQKGAQMANAGFGAASMGTGAMDSAGHAVKGQTMQSITAGATLDAGTTMDDFVAAGAGQGMMSAKQVGSMKAYGANSSLPQAMKAGEFEGTLSAAKDTYIADNGTMGDAKTLGTDSSMQQLGKAKGLQKAGVFNEDGSINTTSKDKVTGQLESDKYTQGLENQSRISTNKIQGVGRLGELSNDQMTNIQRVSQAGVLGEIGKGQALKDKYGANLQGVTNGPSYSEVATNSARLQEDKAIGTSRGYKNLNSKDIQDSAQYGLESSTKSATAAIAQKGGKGVDKVSKAADVDAVDAGLRAASQKSIIDSNLKEGGSKDGLGGSAKEIANAIKELANTAGTKAGAQTRADMTSIATAGGSEDFKKLQADSASMKTAQSMKSVDAAKEAGFMDDKGNITSKGMAAYGITPGEQASALSGKMNIGGSIGNSLQKLKDDQFKIQKSLGKTSEEAEKYAEGLVAPFRDKAGNFLEGQAFWNKQSELKAGVFSGSNSMLLGDGHLFGGAISHNGMTGKVSSGLSSSVNNQYDEKAGKKLDAGVEGEIHKNIEGAEAAERARFAMNPKKWVEGIAAKGHDVGVESLKRLGFNEEEAEEMYSAIASPSVGVAGAVGIAEVASRISGRGSLVGKVWNSTKSGKSQDSMPDHSSNPDKPQPDSEVSNKGQHNNSLNKDLPNDSTSGKNVNRNLDFENMSIDGEEVRTKQPAPHVSNAPHSKWGFLGKALGSVAAAVGIANAGEDIQNFANAVDPSSYIMGQPLGAGSDQFNIPQNTGNYQSPIMRFDSAGMISPTPRAPMAQQNTANGAAGNGITDETFMNSAFLQNMQSTIDMGSFQSLRAGQMSLRNVGAMEEMREMSEVSNELFQESLTDIMNGIEETNDGYY